MKEFFRSLNLDCTIAARYLCSFDYPWQALKGLKNFILALGPKTGYKQIAPDIWLDEGVFMAPSACILGPAVIGGGTEIRHGAFIRGSVIIGKNCVVGNSTEIKNAVLFDGVKAPHFNYVGDSVLGHLAHLGAGAIISNVRADGGEVIVHAEQDVATGLKKFGAVVGDGAEIGCNAVLNPGTVLGKNCTVYPLVSVRGTYGDGYIIKGGTAVPKVKRSR